MEPWLPADGYLFRSGANIRYLKPTRNPPIKVLQQLGPRLSDEPQGYFRPKDPSSLSQRLQPKETRYERHFDPDEGRNVPHHCFLPRNYTRVIKRGKKKGKRYCVVYHNARHSPATCEDATSVRKSIHSIASTPYPLFMLNFKPEVCLCRSTYENEADYFLLNP